MTSSNQRFKYVPRKTPHGFYVNNMDKKWSKCPQDNYFCGLQTNLIWPIVKAAVLVLFFVFTQILLGSYILASIISIVLTHFYPYLVVMT